MTIADVVREIKKAGPVYTFSLIGERSFYVQAVKADLLYRFSKYPADAPAGFHFMREADGALYLA